MKRNKQAVEKNRKEIEKEGREREVDGIKMIIKLSSDKEMEAKCEYVDKNT